MSCFDDIEKFREEHRVLSKDNTVGARSMYSDLWSEYINRYGVQTAYYRNGYKLETQDDFIYGEDPTEPFEDPKIINMVVEYQTDALLLSKFGLETNADLNLTVSVKDYQNVFGLGAEPKAGDVLELTEAGWETSEMPTYDGILSEFNVIEKLDSFGTTIVYADTESTILAPVKGNVNEYVLSYVIPMYTTSENISGKLYPIENVMLPISGHSSSEDYIQIQISGVTYYTPLYIPNIVIESPRTNSLYFSYDIIQLHGTDLIEAGYIPFEYQDSTLLMPIYAQNPSGDPLSATVIISADDLSYMTMDTADLLCKYALGKNASGVDYVNSILIELSAVYGAKYIRCPQLFELTEVKYQDFSQPGLNFAQGHYVWKLHAKRFDYSFEPNAPKECDFNQIYDNSFFGTLSTQDNEPSPEKIYPQQVEEASKEIWDYKEKGTNTDPYGYY